jgi:hypothetical protein
MIAPFFQTVDSGKAVASPGSWQEAGWESPELEFNVPEVREYNHGFHQMQI